MPHEHLFKGNFIPMATVNCRIGNAIKNPHSKFCQNKKLYNTNKFRKLSSLRYYPLSLI